MLDDYSTTWYDWDAWIGKIPNQVGIQSKLTLLQPRLHVLKREKGEKIKTTTVHKRNIIFVLCDMWKVHMVKFYDGGVFEGLAIIVFQIPLYF